MKRMYALWVLLFGATLGIQAQTYCTTNLYTTGCTFGDYLDNVQLNNVNQTATGCSTGGFADYTSDTVNVQQTAMLQLGVTTGYSGQWFALWVDANNDGDFDDAGEHLWSSSAAGPAAGVLYSNTLVIPATLATGNHRMRLRCKWSGTALLATDACSSFSYGEVHDYTVNVAPPPACPQPYYMVAGGATSSTATFSYTSTGSTFEVQYGPTGFTPGTGTTVTVSGTTASISGLSANTCYDFYVRQNCSAAGNGYSFWTGPLSICTPCVTQSLPVTEDFTNWPPNCFFLTGGTSQWTTSGAGAALADMGSSWGSNSTGYMTTAPVNLNALARIKFKWSHLASTWANERLAVMARISGQTTWDTIWSKEGANFDSQDGATWNAPGTFVQETVNLDSTTYYGQVAEFRWVGFGNWGNNAWVDDIMIEQQPTCPEPTGLGLAGVTDTSATLTWSSAGSNFVIEWGPAGFTQGTGFLDTATSNTHTLMGLNGNTSYSYYVMRNCSGAGNGNSIWVGPFNFTTLCSPYYMTPGYYENWDAMTAGDAPGCWTKTQTGSGSTWQVLLPQTWNVAAYSTPNYLLMSSSSATNVTAVSPMFGDLQGNGAQIRVRANKLYNWSPIQLIVGTMASPSSPSTFTAVDTLALTEFWVEYTVAFPSVPAGHNHVALRMIGGTWYDVGIDDFYYEAQPTCLPAQNVSASPSTTTALISWAHGAPTTTGSYVAWGPAGFNPGTGTIPNMTLVNGNTYSITGLTPSSSYTVWVADSCGSGNIGPWQGPVTFTTACLAATMPYSENFDITPLACWDPAGGTKQFLSYSNGAGYSMHGYFWGWTSGNFAELTSRPVTISSNAQASFDWSHQYMTFYPNDQLLLLARPTTSSTWDTIVNLIGANFNSSGAGTTTPGTFVNELAYLPTSYTGSDVIFKFVGNSGYGPDVFFDNFLVEAIPTCPDPVPAAGTVTNNSASVSWTSPGSPLGSCVMWGPAGFYTGTGSVTGTIAHNVTSAYTINGLAAGSTYDVYVRDSCGPTDFSGWAGPVTVTTTLCAPANTCTFTMYEIDSYGDGWNGGQITVEQKSSTGWTPIFTFGMPFTTGSSYTETANLCAGDSARLIVTNPGSWSTEIGFDLVGPFGDTVSSWTPGTSLMAFQVFNTFVAQCSACGVPSGVTATAPACTTATVSWSSGSQATGSTVEYGPAGFAQGQGTTVSASASGTVTLTGLMPGTSYDVIVQDNCNGTTSGWSTAVTFTTASGPLPTLNPNFTVISMNPVTIAFTANASGQDTVGWAFSTGAIQGGDAVTQAFSSNGPAFAVAVAANACGIVADTVYFTVGLDDLNLTSLRLFPNPTAGQFTVEFSHLDAEEVEFRIVTLTGAVVAQLSRHADAGTVRETFDLSKTPAGVYLVEVQTTSGRSVRRIVLER